MFTKLIFWSAAVELSITNCALVSATSVVTAADADSNEPVVVFTEALCKFIDALCAKNEPDWTFRDEVAIPIAVNDVAVVPLEAFISPVR